MFGFPESESKPYKKRKQWKRTYKYKKTKRSLQASSAILSSIRRSLAASLDRSRTCLSSIARVFAHKNAPGPCRKIVQRHRTIRYRALKTRKRSRIDRTALLYAPASLHAAPPLLSPGAMSLRAGMIVDLDLWCVAYFYISVILSAAPAALFLCSFAAISIARALPIILTSAARFLTAV